MSKTAKIALVSTVLLVELVVVALAAYAWLYYSQTYSWGDKHSKETFWALCTLGGVVLLVITIAFAARRKKRP